jgi:diacylglycerol O-acyltransferase / wax synthase
MAEPATPKAPHPLRFEQRMSDAEALMWLAERDPSLRSSFLTVTFLDQAPDFDRFRARMADAVREIPRLHQRVVSAPWQIGPPAWADDPEFDLDYHVRRMAMPAGSTRRDLLDLAANQYQDPFDAAKPLWQFTVVEGVEGEGAALLGKMHHTISDGVGAVRLSAMFVDLEPDPPQPHAPLTTSSPDRGPSASLEPVPPPTLLGSLGDAASEALRVPLDLGRRAIAGVVDTVSNPLSVPEAAGDALEMARSALRQLFVLDGARSALWAGKRSAARHFEVLSTPMDPAKAAANALGGTLNDFLVTAVAGGIAAYHRARDAEVDELRAAMPISTRTDKSAGGNAFMPSRVLVPAGIVDPAERFRAIHDRLNTVKGERSLGMTEALAGLVSGLPPAVVVRLARSQAQTVDFAVSNVRGAPFDLYIGGAHILANYPIGPTGGVAVNATLLSYRQSLDIGLNIDPAAVDNPVELRDLIASEIDSLIAASK